MRSPRGRGNRGAGRLSGARCRHLQLRRRARGRPGPRRLPKGPASQLRRLRRAPLLRAGRHARADRDRGGARWADDLRGHLVPGAARLGGGARRREPDRQSLRLAVPPRAGGRIGSDWYRSGPGRRGRRSRSATWSAARTSWSSTGTAWSSQRRAKRWLAPPSSSSSSCSATSSSPRVPTSRAASGRAGTRERSRRGQPPPCSPGSRCPRRAARSSRSSPTRWSPVAEVYEALKLGLRDYVRKNGFERVLVAVSGGIDSALVTLIAADALGPERVSCVVMPSPHSSDETQADARAIVRAVGAELIEIPIEPAMHAYEELLADLGRWRGGGAGGGEHPGADSRQPGDGALEQVRLAGADHRQQERDVGRLRDPLRRHGGRLRGDQGRAQDARLPAGPVPKQPLGHRAGAASPCSSARHRPSFAPASSIRTRCRPTRCSTASSPPTSRRTAAATRSSPTGSPPRSSTR